MRQRTKPVPPEALPVVLPKCGYLPLVWRFLVGHNGYRSHCSSPARTPDVSGLMSNQALAGNEAVCRLATADSVAQFKVRHNLIGE